MEHKRFDATLEQALAWKRVEAGIHTQDNILGISFGKNEVEVIEWNFNNSDRSRIRIFRFRIGQ